jgi:hypothetical protein
MNDICTSYPGAYDSSSQLKDWRGAAARTSKTKSKGLFCLDELELFLDSQLGQFRCGRYSCYLLLQRSPPILLLCLKNNSNYRLYLALLIRPRDSKVGMIADRNYARSFITARTPGKMRRLGNNSA